MRILAGAAPPGPLLPGLLPMSPLLMSLLLMGLLLLATPCLAQPSSASARFLATQGAATYEISLSVPPGTGGVDPALAITYTSQAGEGLLGSGFDLGGLSEIARCPATLLQDGFSGSISYGGNDRFCLDAGAISDGRLVSTASPSQPYYSAGTGTDYRTEVETYRKVVPSAQACGSGPCSFDVWLKDGSHLQYTATTPAVAAAGSAIAAGSVRLWQLTSVADLHGNSYQILYSQTPTDAAGNPIAGTAGAGVSYPVRIDYTSGPGNLAAQRSVQFHYQAWPGASPQYQGGAVFTRAARLAEIDTCIDAGGIAGKSCAAATPVNRYVLQYAANAPPGRSWLSSFQECDGAGNCLTPVQFDWTPDATTLATQQATGTSALSASSFVGDFDGNGLTDVLSVVSGGNRLLLRQPGGFVTAADSGLDLNGASSTWIADFNADGLSDVMVVGTSDTLYLSSGDFSAGSAGFTAHALPGFELLAHTLIGDVNGDGMADALTTTATSGWLYLGTGSGFAKQAVVTGLQIPASGGAWLADFNGDSMADLLASAGGGQANLYLSTGTGFAPATPLALALSGAFTYVADFNGDGLNDVLSANGQSGVLSAGTGSGFVASALTGLAFQPGNNWVGDFNGDGRADVFSVASGGGTLQLSNGSSFDAHAITGLALAPESSWVGDFNGDGLTDLTSFQGNGYWDALGSASNRPATSNQRPGLLSTIENRLGGQILITYAPITNPSVYTANATAGQGQVDNKAAVNRYHATPLSPNLAPLYPAGTLLQRAGLYVVASYILANDATVNSTAYRYQRVFTYQSAATNLLGRGFLGFGSMTRLEPELSSLTTRTYRQDFPFDREVQSVVIADTRSQQALQTTTYSFQCADGLSYGPCSVDNSAYAPNASRIFQVGLRTRSVSDALLGTTVSRTTTYDSYGNATLVVDSGNSAGTAKAVYTCQSFSNDTGQWRLGYLLFSQIASADCSSAPTAWGGNSQRLNQLVRDPATLDVVASAGWLQQQGVWQGETSGRDAWGNVTTRGMLRAATVTATTPALAGTTYTTSYDSAFRSFRTRVQSPLPGVDQAPALITQYAFDARYGEQVAVIRPDGTFDVRCLDGFEREVIRQGPPPDASITPSDALCLPTASYITGAPALPGQVVTLATSTWEQASGTTIADSTAVLPSWPVAGSRRARAANNPTWPISVRTQDGLSRTVQSANTSATVPVLTSKAFLNPGRLLSWSTLPYFSTTSLQAAATVTWGYDALGRKSWRTAPYTAQGNQPATATRTWARSTGNTVTVTSAANTGVAYPQVLTYDYYGSRRRLVSAAVPGTAITRSYGYTPLGEAHTTTGPVPQGGSAGVSMTLTRDSLGRVATVVEDGIGTRALGYDDSGNLHTVTDALGQVYTRDHDALQRLTQEQWADAAGKPLQQTAWTWDTGNTPHLPGRVASATTTNLAAATAPVTTRYGYDGQGRVSSRAVTIDGQAAAFSFRYLPQGAAQAVTYPDGTIANWSYTPLGAMTTIQTTNAALGTTTLGNQTPTSLAQRISYGNGATAAMAYDASGLLQSRVMRDGNGNPLVAEAYVRDALLRLTQLVDCLAVANASNPLCLPLGVTAGNATDLSRAYGYTDRRLSTATIGTSSYQIAYDPAGNLYQFNGATWPVSGQQLACNGTTAPSWCYDANGNLISAASAGGTRSYAFDAVNRLQSASRGGVLAATFGYDHLGQRTSKTSYAADGTTVAGTTTWASANYVIQTDPSAASAQRTVYIPGPTGPVASFTASGASDANVWFYAQDHALSTQVVTDGSGQLVARIDYGPYGDIASASPAGANAGSRLFGSQFFDGETQLYQFGARYYDPGTGRFLTPDNQLGGTLARQDSFHRYAYTLNDPSTYIDPSGHLGCIPLGLAVGTVFAAFSTAGTIMAADTETDRQKTAAGFNGTVAFVSTGITIGGGLWAGCTYYRDRAARRAAENEEPEESDSPEASSSSDSEDDGGGDDGGNGGDGPGGDAGDSGSDSGDDSGEESDGDGSNDAQLSDSEDPQPDAPNPSEDSASELGEGNAGGVEDSSVALGSDAEQGTSLSTSSTGEASVEGLGATSSVEADASVSAATGISEAAGIEAEAAAEATAEALEVVEIAAEELLMFL